MRRGWFSKILDTKERRKPERSDRGGGGIKDA
jgi:hypothetical protein